MTMKPVRKLMDRKPKEDTPPAPFQYPPPGVQMQFMDSQHLHEWKMQQAGLVISDLLNRIPPLALTGLVGACEEAKAAMLASGGGSVLTLATGNPEQQQQVRETYLAAIRRALRDALTGQGGANAEDPA